MTLHRKNVNVGGTYIDMVYVEGSTFNMGRTNSKFEHTVTLSPYYLQSTPVIQELWEIIMGNNPSMFKHPQRPVERVSWNNVQEFIQKLNAKTGYAFRLLTEAEWEFAAFGGIYGLNVNVNLHEIAWYCDNSSGKTQQAGWKKSNSLGLYDMLGNVWEWCQDWYDTDYYLTCQLQRILNNPVNSLKTLIA